MIPNSATPFIHSGEFIKAAAEYATGFELDGRLEIVAVSGANESMPSEGGYVAVPYEFAKTIIEHRNSFGQIIARALNQPITSRSGTYRQPVVNETSRANGSRWGGFYLQWLAEGATFPSSMPQFGALESNAKSLGGVVFITNELWSDLIANGAWFERTAGREIAAVTEDAMINGDIGKPLGVLASKALIAIEPESGQASQTVTPANLASMIRRFYAGSFDSESTCWVMSAAAFSQLLDSSWANGAPVVTTEKGTRFIAGWPVVVHEAAPSVGSTGDVLLADWSQYILIERRPADEASGLVQSSIHVKFLSDESALRIHARLDAQPTWSGPVASKDDPNVLVSPFVALAER